MNENLHADLEITNKHGITVPIQLDISYPKNQGMNVIYLLNHPAALGSMKRDILQELIARGDLSLLAELPDDEDGDDQ